MFMSGDLPCSVDPTTAPVPSSRTTALDGGSADRAPQMHHDGANIAAAGTLKCRAMAWQNAKAD
jgi:hypothetical protein